MLNAAVHADLAEIKVRHAVGTSSRPVNVVASCCCGGGRDSSVVVRTSSREMGTPFPFKTPPFHPHPLPAMEASHSGTVQ